MIPAPPLVHARCTACWLVAGIAVLVLASFATLDLIDCWSSSVLAHPSGEPAAE